jgi:CheY-like chemotaxis protein
MASAAAPHRGEPPLDGVRLLLVEDHAHSRDALRLLLEHQGAEVVEASDGEEALRLLQGSPRDVDLVLLDLRLPGLTGLEVADRLKQSIRWAAIPLLAITALGAEADFRSTLEAGFAGHVVKPIDPDMLMATIVRVLGTRRPRAHRHGRPPRRIGPSQGLR